MGTLDAATVALAEPYIRQFGLNPGDIANARFAPETAAYLEFHIEQGPVLESLHLPLGVVDAIAGQSRLEVMFEGQANHAGTTPMGLRRDAMAAAAEWIGLVEQTAAARDGLVATTGRVVVEPNATNVVPGRVAVSLDVRHGCDENRQAAVRQLMARASDIAGKRGVKMHYEERLDQLAAPMDAMGYGSDWQQHGRSCRISDASHDQRRGTRCDDYCAPYPVGHAISEESGRHQSLTGGNVARRRCGSGPHRGRKVLMPDLVIRGAQSDIAVEDGAVSAIGPDLPAGKREIDARALAILPGIIDVHVHFNEPGRTEWEGAATGSRAFAAAGGTLFFDMPLNSTPCTVNAHAFDEKHTALAQASVTDFALWGGIIPGNVGCLAELAERGVIGFKAFMSDSGLAEFPRSDDLTLYEGMREAARLDLPVSVHAESEEITRGLTRRMLDAGRSSVPRLPWTRARWSPRSKPSNALR